MKKLFSSVQKLVLSVIIIIAFIGIINTSKTLALPLTIMCWGQGYDIHDILCGASNPSYCCMAWFDDSPEVYTSGCCA